MTKIDYEKHFIWEATVHSGQSDLNLVLPSRMPIQLEFIQLFNPFHSRADGRFTSGPGGAAGGSGNSTSTVEARGQAIEKSRKSGGGIVKTTGKILGIAGLGLVGLAVISAGSEVQVGGAGNTDPLQNADKTERLKAELEELTKNWPKGLSEQQAVSLAIQRLRSLGIDGIPADLKAVLGPVPVGSAGYYDFDTNTLVIDASMSKEIQEGDPMAMWVIMHEVAHSNQELVDGTHFGNLEGFPDGIINAPEYRAYLEGQNDLVTAIAMSDLLGVPTDQDKVVEDANRAAELRSKINGLESGVSVTNLGSPTGYTSLGYSTESTMWAGLAKANQAVTGQPAKEFVVTSHANGFDPSTHYETLVRLFPDEMKAEGYYVEREEGGIFGIGGSTVVDKKLPHPQRTLQWIREHYGVDSQQAYYELLEEAAAQ